MNVRKIFVIASAAIVVLLLSVGVYAQEFTVPPVVEMQRRHYTDVFEGTDMCMEGCQPPYVMPNDLRIWGWSRNGLVAYSTGMAHHGDISEYYVTFSIVNIVRDEEIVRFTYSEAAYGREDFRIPYSELISAVSDRIVQVMEQHNIVAHNALEQPTAFLPFPIRRDGNVFNLKIEHAEGLTYNVIMDRNGRQSKTIKTIEYSNGRLRTAGYFMSPFENRALVVILNDVGACRDDYRIILSGAHLGTGFR